MHNHLSNLVSFAILFIINVITAISFSEKHSVITFRIRSDFATQNILKAFSHFTAINLKTAI